MHLEIKWFTLNEKFSRKTRFRSLICWNWYTSVCNQLLNDPVITQVASEYGRSNAQVLLRWSVQQNIGQYSTVVHK